MTNRDEAYEKAIVENISKCTFQLNAFSLRADSWDSTLQLAVERALQVLIESLIGFSRYFVQVVYQHKITKSREAVTLLFQHKDIDIATYQSFEKMISMRNILVHDYLNINPDIVLDVLNQKKFTIVETEVQKLMKKITNSAL